jgi:mRNA interferase HigB
MKQMYPNADIYGRRTIFNIGGNKYRLIARLNYRTQRVFVVYLLTHAQYDKVDWKA